MEHCANKLGNTYFRTPRTTITSFVNLLAVLEQNKDAKWEQLLGGLEMTADMGAAADLKVEDGDELASFKL